MAFDREMLADVAQEIEAVHAAEPVMVIRHAGRVIALEAEERGDLVADVLTEPAITSGCSACVRWP